MYCSWMYPLARTLYILISITTVLIGFYDLYKNVPVLKATEAQTFGPLFDWIEAWEMISSVKYLGTMFFLQNFKNPLKWLFTVIRCSKKLASLQSKPMVEPLVQLGEYILPLWDLCLDKVENCVNMIWIVMSSTFSCVIYLLQILIFPLLILFSHLSSQGMFLHYGTRYYSLF